MRKVTNIDDLLDKTMDIDDQSDMILPLNLIEIDILLENTRHWE